MPTSTQLSDEVFIVTGGAGFIGSNLVRLLLRDTNAKIVNWDCFTYAGNRHSLVDVENHGRYQLEEIDITDAEAVMQGMARYQPTAVFHLAAESHVDRSIDGAGQFIDTNVVGTFNLLQAALSWWRSIDKSQDFRFIHVSTDEVYGSLDLGDDAFCETTRYDPHSPYSASKAASDHLARAWKSTYGMPVMVTNCSNNYGPFQFPEKLIPVVILKCLRGDPIPVYGTGENVRDWLYVEDHCRALLRVAQAGQAGETYNIGGNNERQNIDLVRDICAILDELRPHPPGSKISSYAELITFVQDRPGHDFRYAIDARKIKSELDWEPAENNQSGMRKTVQWYLDNQEWWESILSGNYKLERQGIAVTPSA
ncbi:MAG: dTDP-glucose 4,6-dehydratase [Verrucomicrobiota bacterium]